MSKSTNDARVVWSNENRYHLHEERVQHPDTNTSAPQDTQQQRQQHSNVEQPLGEDPTAQLAAFFASQPQISSAPYQQQPRHVFGQLLPIIGPNQFVLDEEFRAAAKKSPMLWAFMRAVDQAENEQQEQVEELH
jgi:hypothetical protein